MSENQQLDLVSVSELSDSITTAEPLATHSSEKTTGPCDILDSAAVSEGSLMNEAGSLLEKVIAQTAAEADGLNLVSSRTETFTKEPEANTKESETNAKGSETAAPEEGTRPAISQLIQEGRDEAHLVQLVVGATVRAEQAKENKVTTQKTDLDADPISTKSLSSERDPIALDEELLSGPLGGKQEVGPRTNEPRNLDAGAERLAYEPNQGTHPVSPYSAGIQGPAQYARSLNDEAEGFGSCYHIPNPLELRNRIQQRVDVGANDSPMQFSSQLVPEAPEARKGKGQAIRHPSASVPQRDMVAAVGYAAEFQEKDPVDRERLTRSTVSGTSSSRSQGKRSRKLRKRKSSGRKRGPFVPTLSNIVEDNPEMSAPVVEKERSNVEPRTPRQADFSELPFADADIASSEALEPISNELVLSATVAEDLGAIDLSAREFDEGCAIFGCSNDCAERLFEASKKEKILRELLEGVRSDHERELTEKYNLGTYDALDRAMEFLNEEHTRQIQKLEADVRNQKIHTERLQAIYEAESQTSDGNYEAEIARLNALLQAYEVDKISEEIQVSFEEEKATTKDLVHSLQQTEEDSARVSHSFQQTEMNFASLTNSAQQTEEDVSQLQSQWHEWEYILDQEQKTSAEKLQQVTAGKCRLEAEIERIRLEHLELCEEVGDVLATLKENRETIYSQEVEIDSLNSQHEQDLREVQRLTQRLEDEAVNPPRPIQASWEEPVFCDRIFVDSFQQTEDDIAQLQLRWEYQLDYERITNAEMLQQAIQEKVVAQNDLADAWIELGGLREKVHSDRLELELQMQRNEEKVRKVHAKYDPQRRQDEDRERTRRDKEGQKKEAQYREAHHKWDLAHQYRGDKRTYEVFMRDYRLLTERHDFYQQFPEYSEPVESGGRMMEIETAEQSTGTDAEEVELRSECSSPIPSSLWSLEPVGASVQTEEIETMAQCTGTDAEELRLLDGPPLDIETREQSTETYAEEMEPRSGCVSPAASSLMSLISSRRRLSESRSESSEETSSESGEGERELPVIDSDPESEVLRERISKYVEETAVMNEDIEGLMLHGDRTSPSTSPLSSLLQSHSSIQTSDEGPEVVQYAGPKGNDGLDCGGDSKISTSSDELSPAMMSTMFLRTMDTFSKMAQVVSGAVMEVKQNPLSSTKHVRLSVKKRRKRKTVSTESIQQSTDESGGNALLQKTVELLTLTQRRLDEAEIRARESCDKVRGCQSTHTPRMCSKGLDGHDRSHEEAPRKRQKSDEGSLTTEGVSGQQDQTVQPGYRPPNNTNYSIEAIPESGADSEGMNAVIAYDGPRTNEIVRLNTNLVENKIVLCCPRSKGALSNQIL